MPIAIESVGGDSMSADRPEKRTGIGKEQARIDHDRR